MSAAPSSAGGHPFAPCQHDLADRGRLGRRLEELDRRPGPSVVGPAAAPRRTPEAPVDGVGPRLRRDRELPLLKECDRLLALEAFLTDRSDDGELRRENPEGNVEADLIVPGARRSVGDRRGPDPPRHFNHRRGLLGPLGCDREGIHLAAEDVALNEVADKPVEHRLAGIDGVVLHGAHSLGLPTDRFQLSRPGPAGVDVDSVYGPAAVGEVWHAEGGIEPAGEGEGESLHNA